MTSYSNFKLAFFSVQWDHVGLLRKGFCFHSVGNGQHFSKTCHIDPIICPFFFSSKFKDTASDLSHTFSSLTESPNPARASSLQTRSFSPLSGAPLWLSTAAPLRAQMRATLLGAKASALTVIDLSGGNEDVL